MILFPYKNLSEQEKYSANWCQNFIEEILDFIEWSIIPAWQYACDKWSNASHLYEVTSVEPLSGTLTWRNVLCEVHCSGHILTRLTEMFSLNIGRMSCCLFRYRWHTPLFFYMSRKPNWVCSCFFYFLSLYGSFDWCFLHSVIFNQSLWYYLRCISCLPFSLEKKHIIVTYV